MEKTYRIWNFENGICFDSDCPGLNPEDAFTRHLNREDSFISEDVKYLVAKQTKGKGSNHDEFGIFRAVKPSQPRLVVERVEV